MSHLRSRLTLAAVAAFALASAASADLLITTNGNVIETKGGWRVDGRRIVFTQPNGTLSSIATAAVDLDRSAVATAQAVEAANRSAMPPATSSQGQEAVLRITERDIPPMEGSGDETTESGAAKAGDSSNSAPLEVISWDKVPTNDGDGIQIFGTLRNTGRNTVVNPAVAVQLYGEEGGLLALTEASVNQTSVPAGESANFRAEFPGLPDFAAARFSVSGRGYEASSAANGELAAGGNEPVEADQEFTEPNAEPDLAPESASAPGDSGTSDEPPPS